MARKNKTLGMAGAAAVGVLILLLVGTKQGHVQTSFSNGAELVAGTRHSPDYMSVELRAQVNELKADVAREPTTKSTATERADVLWRWANAYALTGGIIPNDLPLVIRAGPDVGTPGERAVVGCEGHRQLRSRARSERRKPSCIRHSAIGARRASGCRKLADHRADIHGG